MPDPKPIPAPPAGVPLGSGTPIPIELGRVGYEVRPIVDKPIKDRGLIRSQADTPTNRSNYWKSPANA